MTQGNPQQAQALCDRFQAPFPCLADPQRQSYKTFGLKRGTWWDVLLNPAVLSRGMEAARKGHHIERAIGDVMQSPGTFIIDREGTVRFAKYARHSGDHPHVSELVAALQSIAQS